MHGKEPKKLDTKFVLSEIDAIKQSIRNLDEKVDKLYANLLYEEAEEFTLKCKTISAEKIQKKFNIGYARACYLIEALLKNGIIVPEDENNDVNMYNVSKRK